MILMIMDDIQLSQTRRLISLYSMNIMNVLDAVSNENRFKMLLILLERAASFNDLEEIASLGKTATAHHLKVLVATRLIEKIKRGQYKITCDGINLLNSIARMYFFSNIRKIQDFQFQSHQIQMKFTEEEVTKMKNDIKHLPVEIINLPPMKVASVRAIGKNPEELAWNKLQEFASPLKLFENLELHPIFGFNNPDPIPGQPEYGYEYWIKVDSSIHSTLDVKIIDFPGELYAVTKCNLTQECQSPFLQEHGILESWFLLNQWVKNSVYQMGNHQWLEKHLSVPMEGKDLILDLYLPIMRK